MEFKIKKYHIIIALLIGIIFLLAKCNSDLNNNLKSNQIIYDNNISVIFDSIKKIKTKAGSLIFERGVLISNKKDLEKLNSNLYNKIKELEKYTKNPKVVVNYKTIIEHDTIIVDNFVYKQNDSTYKISFKKDTLYNQGNSRNLEGDLVVLISKKDLKVSEFKITKDQINLDATLVLGEKDGQLKVWIESKYPNLNLESIDAVTLDPKIHKKLNKLNNKSYSVGPYVGFGLGFNNTVFISPMIGIGLQYTLFKF